MSTKYYQPSTLILFLFTKDTILILKSYAILFYEVEIQLQVQMQAHSACVHVLLKC